VDNPEVGTIQLGSLSVVSMMRLKALFLQSASEAREAEDDGAESFLTELAGIIETAQNRNVKAMFSGDGSKPN
jgi:hypothetical protein